EELMMKMSIFGAAAILITAAASPSITQAAGCALYDPSCATYPMPNNEGAGKARTVRVDDGTQQNVYRSAARTARIEQRAAVGARHYANDAGGPVRAAGAVAAGTVGAAGAIATAPFRTADSYAFYKEGYSGC